MPGFLPLDIEVVQLLRNQRPSPVRLGSSFFFGALKLESSKSSFVSLA